MSILRKRRHQYLKITPERTLAGGAMAIVALGFVQPTFTTLANMTSPQPQFAAANVDRTPVGSVDSMGKKVDEKIIHGLTGILKRLRD